MTVSAEFSKFFAMAIESSLITEIATYIFVLKETVLTAFTVSGDTSLCSCKVVAPADFMMRKQFLRIGLRRDDHAGDKRRQLRYDPARGCGFHKTAGMLEFDVEAECICSRFDYSFRLI